MNLNVDTMSRSTSERSECPFCRHHRSYSLMRNVRDVVCFCHYLFLNRILLLRCLFECCNFMIHPCLCCCVDVEAVAGGCHCCFCRGTRLYSCSHHRSDSWFHWLRLFPRLHPCLFFLSFHVFFSFFVRRPWRSGPSDYFLKALLYKLLLSLAVCACWRS
jgi:hypothetical protein